MHLVYSFDVGGLENGVVNLKTPEVMQGFPGAFLGVTAAPTIYSMEFLDALLALFESPLADPANIDALLSVVRREVYASVIASELLYSVATSDLTASVSAAEHVFSAHAEDDTESAVKPDPATASVIKSDTL